MTDKLQENRQLLHRLKLAKVNFKKCATKIMKMLNKHVSKISVS